MHKVASYLRGGLLTTINVLLYTWTLHRYLFLEGRVSGGVFRNWIRLFRYRPRRFVQPQTEEEIVSLVRNTKRLRVFGAGHSFNSGIVGETLVSLDRYTGVLWTDMEKKHMAVRGGTRVRDIVKELLARGLALAGQPSHDAQSIAGILSTDVHGTGRDWGFVSESVVSLKLVDGRGQIHECFPDDDLFKAAIGGVGAVGILFEVVIRAVDHFSVEQKVQISDLSYVERHLDWLLQANDHFSIYAFPFTEKCQINTWNHTQKPVSILGAVREQIVISLDALSAAWLANFFAYSGLLPSLSTFLHNIKKGTDLVLESGQAFNRTMYPMHQELEFTVPYEQTFTVLRAFMKMYENLQPQERLAYTLFEIRFTPAGRELSWLGAGRERQSVWIHVNTLDSQGVEAYFSFCEELMMALGGRPHLGKWNKRVSRGYMAYVHGEKFERFRQLVREHDPAGKFVNEYTRRLFEPDAAWEEAAP